MNCCRLESSLKNDFFFFLFADDNIHTNVWKSPKDQSYVERELWRTWGIEFLREPQMADRLSENRQIRQITTENILIFIGPCSNERITPFTETKTGCLIHEQKIKESRGTIYALEERTNEKDDLIKKQKIRFQKEKYELLEQIRLFENKLIKLKNAHEKLKVEHEETLYNLGKLSVERAANISETKKSKLFETLFLSRKPSVCIAHNESDNTSTSAASPSSSRHEVVHFTCDTQHFSQAESNSNSHVSYNFSQPVDASIVAEDRDRPVLHLAHAVQEEESRGKEAICLSNEPHSSVPADMYNAYKLLLSTISYNLLFNDIVELKNWANEQFSVETCLSAMEILFELDRKAAINAMDLRSLTAFFETIIRYDLVHLIDNYCSGDYVALKRMISMVNSRKRLQNRTSVANVNPECLPRIIETNTNMKGNVDNTRVLERTSTPDDHTINASNCHEKHDTHHLILNRKPIFNVRGNRTTARGNSEFVQDSAIVNRKRGNSNDTASYETAKTSAQRSRIGIPGSTRSSSKESNIQNHHSKRNDPSKSQPADNFQRIKADNHENDKWLCKHYQRRCFAKFDCCKTFWPCHRCHNSKSTCGRHNLKARDTKMVKCVECGKEQQLGENFQYCIQCNTEFADYYCGQCKSLSGRVNFPFHCDKCGICRVNRDQSFHCDICGVCIDIRIRRTHKCRPESAHDECCICLEDSFNGCQVLPCSHKVHGKCFTQMKQSGITRCPICRKSFAHKPKRRPTSKRTKKKNERRRK